MKKIIMALCLFLPLTNILAQDSLNKTKLLKEQFDLRFRSDSSSYNADTNKRYYLLVDTQHVNTLNRAGLPLLKVLIELERPTVYENEVNRHTRQVIMTKQDIYTMVLLERAIKEHLDTNLHLQEKLLNEVSARIRQLSRKNYSYYTFDTRKKQPVKFISIRSGNDLFTLTGLFSTFFLPENEVPKDGNIIFQRNDDRDYTGALLLEVGTDYMNTLRRRPLKSYQTVLYGFDVYTPYFKSDSIFPHDTSYNRKDRPHATFQYFGWSKKALSKDDRLRWSTTLKFGKIGGSAGPNFQNVLHQDVSYSPRPKGWGAQIGNGGRLGVSVEVQHSYQFHLTRYLHPDHFGNVYIAPVLEEKIGTYMTTIGGGAFITNKSFAQNNPNFINRRTKQTVYGRFHHFMYRVGITSTYVHHNTMLEGFGIFATREEEHDEFTPKSKYYLSYGQVERLVHVFNITLSYTSRYATFFYNWRSISPETKLGKIGIPSPSKGIEMDISNRWHHFAEIGLTFNLH